MKAVILAGGLGSRISEESHLKPKPMIEIGDKPILWHIMKLYQAYGVNEFIICLGYKGYVIKEYFANYYLHNSDVTFDLSGNQLTVHKQPTDSFKVTLVDTGIETMTAGRLQRIKPYLEGEEDFFLTYGDALADLDIQAVHEFHRAHGRVATVTAVQPASKFGALEADAQGLVTGFEEKPSSSGSWINGGFFVLNSAVFNYLSEDMDSVMWEQGPMPALTRDGQLVAYRHQGFWKCMDILRDKVEFEALWETNPKWKKWD
jgi:glucose-1-phosphate cytidylyltransferase